jgi:protein involved in polysaccharide export with SLBB domain
MKTRLILVVLIAFCAQISLFAQNPLPIAQVKLGKLQPGDQLSIAFHRDPDREGGMLNLILFFTIFEDGTIRVPFLDKVPAAGLSIFELTQALQDDYNSYFALPPMATANPPAHVVVEYTGHGVKMAIDRIIEKIGKTSLSR